MCKPFYIEITREIPLKKEKTRQTIDKKSGLTIEEQILEYCKEPRTITEIKEQFGIPSKCIALKRFTKPLINEGKLNYTIPEDADNMHQMYLTNGIEITKEIEEIIKQKSTSKIKASFKNSILEYCKEPRGMAEIREYIGTTTANTYVRELVEEGKLKYTLPYTPWSNTQKYIDARLDFKIPTEEDVVEFCKEPRTKKEIEENFDFTPSIRKSMIQRLLDKQKICYTEESLRLGKYDGNRRLVRIG